MIGHTSRQSALFFIPLAVQLSLIKDDLLDSVDSLLDDLQLIDLVRQKLCTRRPRSSKCGRNGIAPDRLLRCVVLKHLKGWSFRQLERELRASLLYRRFTRFDADPTPDFSTFSRTFGLLGPDVTHEIHDRVVAKAAECGVAPGRKLRADSTVVETNIHHPTDSTLLGDGIRVLTRALRKIAGACRKGTLRVVDHARAAKRRLLEISRAAKVLTLASQDRMKGSYAKLVAMTKGVVSQAEATIKKLGRGALDARNQAQVVIQAHVLDQFLPLVKKVVAQTEERVFRGNRHVVGKVLSLFEPHSVAIRKGKAHKPTEFGRLVRLAEVENGIVSQYEMPAGNPSDSDAWQPALVGHVQQFERPPEMATGDRGYFSAENERLAKDLGVANVALPARGRLSGVRRQLQKSRWFRRALRWRAGIEARIATLKHRFSMARTTYKGERGTVRYVGWCVIVHNLVSIARAGERRKARA
jgi:IS5 family transposase